MKKIKYFLPSICLMILIFSFSQQTGTESSHFSTEIMIWIQNHLHIPITEFIIRKVAHMTEYALLALSLYYGFSHIQHSQYHVSFFTIFITFLYACTDELHQLFISGRAGQLTDVMIDTCGGILAVVFIVLIKQCQKRKE